MRKDGPGARGKEKILRLASLAQDDRGEDGAAYEGTDMVREERAGSFDALRLLILISNRNLGFFPARIAPCFVEALDHISPLCSAGFASPDTILSRKSFPTFLSDISIRMTGWKDLLQKSRFDRRGGPCANTHKRVLKQK